MHGILVENNIKSYKKSDDYTNPSILAGAGLLNTRNAPSSSPMKASAGNNQNGNGLVNSFNNLTASLFNASQNNSLAAIAGNLSNMMFNPYMAPIMQLLPNENLASSSNNDSTTKSTSEQNDSKQAKNEATSDDETQGAADVKQHHMKVEKNKMNGACKENGSSDGANNKPVSCDLCMKEFFNEEFLKLHKINKHSDKLSSPKALTNNLSQPIDSSSEMSNSSCDQFKSSSTNATLTKQQQLALNTLKQSQLDLFGNNQAAAMAAAAAAGITNPAIFGIMDSYFAAKMADRVTCDICNKQVCNKYFLKTHKLKVHGCVDGNVSLNGNQGSNGDDEYDNDEMMYNSEYNNAETSSKLLMGYDEEGCADQTNENEIQDDCDEDDEENNNESNSKYSSKKSNKLTTTSNKSDINSTLMNALNNSKSKSFNLDPSNSVALAAQLAASFGNLGQLSSSQSNNNGKSRPPALARVICHICRKELCNKYFLKSHLLNAHQITADDFLINSLVEQQQQQSQQNEKLFKNVDFLELTKKLSMFNNNFEAAVNNNNNSGGEMKSKSKSGASRDRDDEHQQSDESESTTRQGAKRKCNQEGYEEDNESSNGSTPRHLASKSKPKASSSSSDLANMAMSLATGIDSNSAYKMQPFLFECQDEAANIFPCMVYLPVGSKLSKSITMKVTLKPVDMSSDESNEAGDENSNELDEEEMN